MSREQSVECRVQRAEKINDERSQPAWIFEGDSLNSKFVNVFQRRLWPNCLKLLLLMEYAISL